MTIQETKIRHWPRERIPYRISTHILHICKLSFSAILYFIVKSCPIHHFTFLSVKGQYQVATFQTIRPDCPSPSVVIQNPPFFGCSPKFLCRQRTYLCYFVPILTYCSQISRRVVVLTQILVGPHSVPRFTCTVIFLPIRKCSIHFNNLLPNPELRILVNSFCQS